MLSLEKAPGRPLPVLKGDLEVGTDLLVGPFVKARLDKAVSNLIQLNISLVIAGRVAFYGSSESKLFYDFIKTLSSVPTYEQRRHF